MEPFKPVCAVAISCALFSSACSAVDFGPDASRDESGPEHVAAVEETLSATGSGLTYANQCASYGVPLPPNFGSATLGSDPGEWEFKGQFGDGFLSTGIVADVYISTSNSPPGLCAIAAHYDT